MRFAGDTGAIHRLRDAGADRIAQDRAAGAVFMIPYVGRKPPAPFGQLDGQPLQDRMQRDVTGLLALAGDRDRAGDQVDVLTADRGDLADPQTRVRAEQDHRPSPPGHPRAEQDGEVLRQRAGGLSAKTIQERLAVVSRLSDPVRLSPVDVDRFLANPAWSKSTRATYHGAIRAWSLCCLLYTSPSP